MKKILIILGTITLVGTSITTLVACNKPQEYKKEELAKLKEENKINTTDETIKNNLEWIAPQEKPFNKVDDKYYYVVWRGDENDNWKLFKFHYNEKLSKYNDMKILTEENNYKLELHRYSMNYEVDLNVYEPSNMTNCPWRINKRSYFKSVYRWNLDTKEPDLIIDDKGNVKVKGE